MPAFRRACEHYLPPATMPRGAPATRARPGVGQAAKAGAGPHGDVCRLAPATADTQAADFLPMRTRQTSGPASR